MVAHFQYSFDWCKNMNIDCKDVSIFCTCCAFSFRYLIDGCKKKPSILISKMISGLNILCGGCFDASIFVAWLCPDNRLLVWFGVILMHPHRHHHDETQWAHNSSHCDRTSHPIPLVVLLYSCHHNHNYNHKHHNALAIMTRPLFLPFLEELLWFSIVVITITIIKRNTMDS